MSHISKPLDWEVFNIPPVVQPVQYYSILKKKREFSHLIRQYDSQVFKHGYLHYCGIVPKNINSCLNNRYEIFIVFLDEIPNTSFIGFRVKVSKETFVHESNSLLLFLKKSKKAIFYLMNNNCIHVQCGTNAWELFYLLYDDYLRKYVLTIIGTQFFYHFVFSFCIQREIQLLELLYKGSKVIRVSKKSIYYKIHRKRKISVTDLIHMTLNMPKSKRYVISCFSSKEPLLYTDLKDCDFYTVDGNKINVSKLVLKKFKKQFQSILPDDANKDSLNFERISASSDSIFYTHPEPLVPKYKLDKQISNSNSTLKRKFEEVDNSNHSIQPGPSTSKFKIIKADSLDSVKEICEEQWEQYQTLKPFTVKSYSGMPCINHLVPNLLKNGDSSNYVDPKKIFSNLQNSQGKSHKSYTFPEFSGLTQDERGNDAVSPPSAIEKTNKDCLSTLDDINFTTAAGKSINVSSTAMLTAHKLIQGEFSDDNQALHERVNYDSKMYRKTSNVRSNYSGFRKQSVAGYIPFTKVLGNKPCHDIKTFKDREATSKILETAVSSNVGEIFKIDSLETLEDCINFSTAAGKTITVSNTSMQKAHKLIQDVFSEENKPTSSGGVSLGEYKNKIFTNASTFRDIGCPSRKSVDEAIDVDMDKSLVEKFFEDTLFDEKELESTTESNTDENLVLELKNDNLSTRKPRKSLGGRRSMKYCSDKL